MASWRKRRMFRRETIRNSTPDIKPPSSVPQHDQAKKADTGWLGVYVGLGVTLIILGLPAMGIELNFWWAFGIIAGAGFLVAWSLWKHALPSQNPTVRGTVVILWMVVIAALEIYGVSNYHRKQVATDNQTTREALDLQKREFGLKYRPLVTISAHKPDTNNYLVLEETEKALRITAGFEIKNIGGVATAMLSISKDSSLDAVGPDLLGGHAHVSPQILSEGVALAPGESRVITAVQIRGYASNADRDTAVESLKAATIVPESPAAITTSLVLNYHNPENAAQKYRTIAVFRETVSGSMVVRQEYQDLPLQK
jgi:hypothetical protein